MTDKCLRHFCPNDSYSSSSYDDDDDIIINYNNNPFLLWSMISKIPETEIGI